MPLYVELTKTTNKFTGAIRLYAHNTKLFGGKIRITKSLFEHYERIAIRQECLHSQSTSHLVRQFKTVVI